MSDPATRFPLLFSPFRLGAVEIRNRFVFQPHFTALGTLEGMPSPALTAYHRERARGGVGLIVMESQAIHPTGKMSDRFLNAWDPAVIPGLAEIAEAVHGHGAKIFSQLTHGGHTSLMRPPHIMWAPTQMPEPSSHFNTKAVDEDDIAAVIAGFAAAARNVMAAGHDGIEIKIAHDGLLRSFASPYFNRRTDRWGGSFENRMRLSIAVMEAIKAATGPSVPLGVRICLDEFTPFGYDLEYGLRMVAALEATGLVDYFNADAGSFSSYWMEIPPAAVASEEFDRLNVALKQATKLPVVAFGRITPPSRGEAMIRDGHADMIGLARQLVADPETVEKLRTGRGHLIRICIACNDACIHQVGQEKGIRCIQNPSAGREATLNDRDLAPASEKHRIAVVGGGPAGMKVAEIAARRGHEVVLLERDGTLGGLVRLAMKQPEHEDIGEVTSHLEAVLGDLGVDVRRRFEATPEALADLGCDTIVVATGSETNLPGRNGAPYAAEVAGRQVLPDTPGLDLGHVVSVDRVLSGDVALSGHVVVIDGNGHWEAAGTAEFLADNGCRVTVVASYEVVGSELEDGTRTLFFRRAAIKGLSLVTSTVVTAIEPGRVRTAQVFSSEDAIGWGQYLLIPGNEGTIEEVDWVVPVIGRRSRDDLYVALKKHQAFKSVRIERVGDCVAPRLIQSNILEAYQLAETL
ncbi:oxidoreductase [Rhodobium gokarnense]|uniref:oxidoreductase n=1 Tax=Rhodobium gokarnense TaxID=364296 RepID=UPI00222441F9|nr:FAD-dependent oxidoreductase [Rhodobium gokarnense]